MAKITIGFGILLIALGAIGYFGTGTSSPTALIPAGFGAALLLCGLVALKDNLRMHAMHGAVLVGLLGFLGGAVRAIQVGLAGEIKLPVAFGMTVAMALACALFVALCVRSFIQARRARAARQGQ